MNVELISRLSKQAMDYAAEQYGPQRDGEQVWDPYTYDKKFAELIIAECEAVNKQQSYELLGVIVDAEEGDGFDGVCLWTVKKVEHYLCNNGLTEHFGDSNEHQ